MSIIIIVILRLWKVPFPFRRYGIGCYTDESPIS
jgi:hypothetical protein